MTRPNILLICTDQQRFSALASAGNSEISTPNLDELAARGVRFDQCYVQNPVCAPSRASLMTGQYVHSHGLWANGVSLPSWAEMFSKTLAEAGYDCGLVGKLHLAACFGGRTERRHDDGFRVFRWAHDPYPGSSENHYHRWLRAKFPGLYERALEEAGNDGFDTLPTEAHYSHWVGEEAIDFLTRSREKGKPFLFIANFFDPHHGFGAPREYRERYQADAISGPITRPRELDDKPEIQREASRRSYAGHMPGFCDYTPDQIAEIRANYYAMVTLIDDEVGRLLATLEETGLAEETLVVFTSDHGEMLGDHQLLLKGPMLYEEAVRVPLIMAWPGRLPAGRVVEDIVQWVDLPATFLAAAGVEAPTRGQGTDLLPLARGEEGAFSRGWALSEYRNSGHPYADPAHLTMLRTGRWKIVVSHGAPAAQRDRDGELYDLETDPHELVNLWRDPAYRRIRSQLTEKLLDVLVATEDRSQPREANW